MAAYIEQDSELFTNLVPAQAIPSGKVFYAFRDSIGAPGVFSLGTDSVLNLFVQKDGKLQNTNFAEACGFSDPVTAVAVRQAHDSSLFIAFSLDKSGTNQIVVLPKLALSDLSAPDPSNVILSGTNLPQVHGIFMSDYTNSSFNSVDYPDVVLAFQPLDKVVKEEDCGLLQFTANGASNPSAAISKSWSLPLNVDKVLDIAFARSTAGNGVAVLYEIQGKPQILYSTYDEDNSDWNVTPDCPAGATCLASYMTAQGTFAGYSGILVGSTQITAYTTSQYVHRPSSKVKPGIVIQGDLLQVGLKDIHVAQLDAELSVWFTNNNDAAGYYHVDTSSSLSDGRLVSLLSEGDGGRLSGMMTTANLGDATVSVNTIISVDESGHLTSLQQSTLAGSWDAYPLMMSTKVANFKVQSYTTRLRVMTDGNNPAGNATFTLTSSGRVSAIINGKENYVDPNGITMKTDASGETTFIVATADVSSHTFQISNVTGADGKDLAIDLQTVDPSGKSMTRLKGITDGPSLKDATTQKGNKLIDPSGLDEDTINQAGTIIKQLYDHSQTLTPGQPPLKSRQAFKVSPSFKAQQPCDDSKPSNSGKELPKSIKAVTVGSVEETAGEWWHWVTQKADEAETWIIDTAKDVADFVVTIAGKAFRFILDTITAVGKAFQWVFDKLKIAFQDLIDFLGFLFEWEDILATKNSLSAFMTVGLNWASGKVNDTIPKIDSFFSDLKNAIQAPRPSVSNQPVNQGPSDTQNTKQSMGFNWSKYHLVHSGGTDNYQPANEPASSDSWQGVWESIIQPAIDDLQTDVQKLIDDIQKAFGNSDSSVSITDALTVIGQDLAVTILDVIKNIVDGLVKLIAQLLKWLADVGNATINIPVFSALYREITDGHELTAFDAICLVIAVPTTLLAKAVTGNALPDISKSLDTNAFDQYVKGNDPLGMNQIAAYGCVSAGIIGIAIGLVGFALDNIDPVSAMAVTSKSTQPRMRLGAIGADVISGYDLCNLVTGLCNTLLAVPSQKTLDKVGEDSVVWGMWSLMAYRWILAGLLYGINKSGAKPTPGAKVGIAGFNILGAAAQYGLQIYVSHKMGGGSENEGRRDAIATCYFVGAACRAATTIAAVAEQPEVEVVTGALFCYAALGSVGLQLWNVESTKNGGWWDSMPTVA